uniref:Uncharacterized protein n=1 Tax=Anguilla anguilla TaxID=7936 RepID=A0A0E9WLM8_ANGAN
MPGEAIGFNGVKVCLLINNPQCCAPSQKSEKVQESPDQVNTMKTMIHQRTDVTEKEINFQEKLKWTSSIYFQLNAKEFAFNV